MIINTEELTPKDWAEIMGVTREIAKTSYSYPEIIVDFYNSFNIDDMDSSWYEVGNAPLNRTIPTIEAAFIQNI